MSAVCGDATGTSAGRLAHKRRTRIAAEPDPDAKARTRGGAGDLAGLARRPREHPLTTYLRSRGLNLPASPALRFHAGLKHPSGGIWPAMVALVTLGGTGSPIAVHRTFLARDGGGKAPVDPQKMMLGPCRGGVGASRRPRRRADGRRRDRDLPCRHAGDGKPAWAALSTSGLRSLDLPRDVRDVIVLADGDEPGEAAAQDCARRWKREGRRVRIARPPQGMDFNDLLKAGAPSFTEGAR